ASGQAPGRYQILAAINAVHTGARDVGDTDWSQVVALYDQLVRLDPSPIVRLNRAIAVAELDGPEVRWRRLTVCRSRATTPSTPPAPTCCAGWAGARSRGRRTTGPSGSPATPPRRRTSCVAATSSPARDPHPPGPRLTCMPQQR